MLAVIEALRTIIDRLTRRDGSRLTSTRQKPAKRDLSERDGPVHRASTEDVDRYDPDNASLRSRVRDQQRRQFPSRPLGAPSTSSDTALGPVAATIAWIVVFALVAGLLFVLWGL